MNDPIDPASQAWFSARSMKAKTAFRKHVTELLDALAPEKILGKAERARQPVEQHRTPDGCVLQGADSALQVAWYDEKDNTPAQLHVVVWSGVLSRRGAPPRGGAKVVAEEVFFAVESPSNEQIWRDKDDTRYDTPSLAQHCLARLEAQSNAS